MDNHKYNIELEVITPLSVGAGNDNDWINGVDYIQTNGWVYVLDLQKIAKAGFDMNRLASLFLKSDDKGIVNMLGNRLNDLYKYRFRSPAETANPIKTFQKTQLYGTPNIAGSSLKGSIRSALFKYLRTAEKDNVAVFGSMKDGTDFMRFIRVTDFEMECTKLINTKLFNLRKDGADWYGGWKHSMFNTTENFDPVGFNTLYECAEPESIGYGSITLAANAFELLKKQGAMMTCRSKKESLMNGTIKDLFHVINIATRDYLKKERTFFETYPAERSEELIDCIDELLALIPSDDSSCLMKMSAGVGFHSITGDWQYKDYCDEPGYWEIGRNSGKKKYKSRKIAVYKGKLQLMGFVKMREMNSEELAEAIAIMKEEHEEVLAKLL